MPHSIRIAELLLDIEAIKLSLDPPFTWTSGIKSPIYCDNRMIYGHPKARNFIVDALTARVEMLHIQPDAIAGTATAAIGWGALVADRLELPYCYVRKEAKAHGAKKRIEGDLQTGKHVVLIEDLFSTGGSAVSSVLALREEAEAVVSDAVGIFSYQLSSATESALEHGIKLHPLSNFATLIEVAIQQGRLGTEHISDIQDFISDPKKWRV